MVFANKSIFLQAVENQKGFSLIELYIFLAALSLILAAFAHQYSVGRRTQYQKETMARQDAVREAITLYFSIKGFLPCPADPSLPKTDPDYGSAIDCTNPAQLAAHPNILRTNAGSRRLALPASDPHHLEPTADEPNLTYVLIGAVPTRALSLPDSYMAEPGGHLFIYAITQSMTDPNEDESKGAVELLDPYTGASVLTLPSPPAKQQPSPYGAGSALYAVISPGRDGIGSFNADGIRYTTCASGTLNDENCNGDTVFYYGGYSGALN